MHRLFVALRPPGPIRDGLIDTMDDSPQLRWVGDDNLHLTLRFVGEVERHVADDLAAALEAVRFHAFELKVSGVVRFERRSGGALWAAVEPKQVVAELAAKVERACVTSGIEPDHRAFHPHITIARYGRREAEAARDFERTRAGLRSGPWHVDRFILFESQLSRHGAHYEEVASYPLDDG